MPKGEYKRMHPFTAAFRTVLAKNCTRCGHWRQGHEFNRRPDGYLQSVCKHCHHVSAKVSDKKANRESRKKATNSNAYWSAEDVKKLKKLTEAGKSGRETAEALGRTIAAIYVARTKYL